MNIGLGADVDAVCRLVEDQDPRLGREPFREHDLLLVAAREAADDLAGEVALIRSWSMNRRASARSRRGRRKPPGVSSGSTAIERSSRSTSAG